MILPDSEMPVDKNGTRADIIIDSSSTISRMNVSRAYEAYIGATARDNRLKVINMIGDKFGEKGLFNVTKDVAAYVIPYLRGLYGLINSEMVMFLDDLSVEEGVLHVKEVIERAMFIYYPTDNERNAVDVIDDIEKSIYKPLSDKVSYVDASGATVVTKDNVQMGYMYFMILEKIANLYSAVSSSKVNNFGFPVKGDKSDKHQYQHSQTPTKVLASAENRGLLAHIPAEAVADMVDLALNPTSHKTLYRHILQSDTAYASDSDICRKDTPYGETKSLQTLNHIYAAAGFKMSYEEETFDILSIKPERSV